MKLTPELVYEYIEKADKILTRSYSAYQTPVIASITLTRAESYWATIQKDEFYRYHIRVSRKFEEISTDDLFEKRLTSCMIHELIHTIPGCMNHGPRFKNVADLVNYFYPKYNIQTSTTGENYGVTRKERPDRYLVKCSSCGAESKYKRKPAVWQWVNRNISPFRCTKCGHSSFIGIELF